MADTARLSARAPWIIAGVLGLVALVLAAVLAFVLPGRNRDDSLSGAGLASSEQQALDAARQETVNFLTYSRKNFQGEYARTLAGAMGGFKDDLNKQKAAILTALTKGKFDLMGAVTGSAFEEVNGDSSLILVSAQGYKLPDGAARVLQTTARFEVTIAKIKGKWLVSDLQSVGIV